MSEHLFYRGLIRHRRFTPVEHEFNYRLFLYCLDLDNLSGLFNMWPLTSISRPALGRFSRSDHIGGCSGIGLKDFVLNKVENQLGFRPLGRVTLLTQLRIWGYIMNPIAVYCCHDIDGKLQAMGLQVTNTPWGQQHLYVLKADSASVKQCFVFDKAMHVSPFHPMNMRYRCRYTRQHGKLVLHLENHCGRDFISDATLVLREQPLTRKMLCKSVLLYPYSTAKIFYGIYKQAVCLYLKKNPIYSNPSSTVPDSFSRKFNETDRKY